MDAAGQVLRNIQLAFHERPGDDQFCGLVPASPAGRREAGPLPGLDLFAHRLEVPLHAVHSGRKNVYQAQLLGVLGEHGREHARDNVAMVQPFADAVYSTVCRSSTPLTRTAQ